MDLTDGLLLRVEKPARYIGNETNMVKKDPAGADIRFAFCFPDIYEVGMSHLGLQILYYFINRRDDAYCERAFMPWGDMEALMRERGMPLYSLETYTPLNEFDILGFTLQYELCYTNVLNMLDLAGVPPMSKDRSRDDPIVCAGGPCAFNPEPVADFFDFFYIGEGEVSLDAVLDAYKENKRDNGTKADFLKKIASIGGIYVPAFYDVAYNGDGTVAAVGPNPPGIPRTVAKTAVADLDGAFYPDRQLVPLIEVVHDRVTLELFRGCPRGCRFCQAGFVCRPMREKDCKTLVGDAETLLAATGHDEISLLSLSTSDYGQIGELTTVLTEKFRSCGVNIALPSMRVDAFNLELTEKIGSVRKSSLTFAPEAGSQRLRDVINKNLTDDDILGGCELAFRGGFNKIKLYFMAGLPTETDEDLAAVGALCDGIVRRYHELPKELRGRPVDVSVSVSFFVPKPLTPFQWEAQASPDEFLRKQAVIRKSITKKQIRYSYHHAETAVLEGVFARGDRRLSAVILRAWQLGAKFDGWSEHFRFGIWKQAFDESGISPEFYTSRRRGTDEVLPWDHISAGVTKEFLVSESEKSRNGQVTANCMESCAGCGAAGYGGTGGVCRER